MKKILLFISSVMVFTACHNYQADIDKLESQKKELVASANYKDSTIAAFINEVNEIESNLASIEVKQNKVALATANGELKSKQIDRIKENITAINDLMKENKEKIIALNKKLKASGLKLGNLEKMVASLNEQIAGKDKELADLNERVVTLNVTVAQLTDTVTHLTADNTTKQSTIDDQTTRLHTAYYTTGTAKELLQKEVLVKEGGFLGLGRSKVLKDNYNNSALNEIDITKTSTIPIDAKDAHVVTNHPTDSYTIQHAGKDQISSLVITDPDKFWKSSKVLVVVVDK
jgi:chromosome segregation ATPase